jgi:hypothetical protein
MNTDWRSDIKMRVTLVVLASLLVTIVAVHAHLKHPQRHSAGSNALQSDLQSSESILALSPAPTKHTSIPGFRIDERAGDKMFNDNENQTSFSFPATWLEEVRSGRQLASRPPFERHVVLRSPSAQQAWEQISIRISMSTLGIGLEGLTRADESTVEVRGHAISIYIWRTTSEQASGDRGVITTRLRHPLNGATIGVDAVYSPEREALFLETVRRVLQSIQFGSSGSPEPSAATMQ